MVPYLTVAPTVPGISTPQNSIATLGVQLMHTLPTPAPVSSIKEQLTFAIAAPQPSRLIIPSETPHLYKWTNICPPLRHLSPTKLSSLEETMMQPCPSCSSPHQITSPSIIRDGKSPPPNTPFNGLPETPTVQWMDLDNALFKYPAPAMPP